MPNARIAPRSGANPAAHALESGVAFSKELNPSKTAYYAIHFCFFVFYSIRMKHSFRFTIAIAAAFIVTAACVTITHAASIAGTKSNTDAQSSTDARSSTYEQSSYKPPITGTKLDQYTAHPKRLLVIVTKQGTIKLQLFEKIAPNHVANIIDLANTHFYDGTYFHRVIPGFMIQGGDPNTKDDNYNNDGQGNGPRMLKAEFNDIHHTRGILSMARANDPNSASCQFFICVADAGFLDHQYTAFGQVVDGMDVVDKIVNLPDVTGAPPQVVQQRGKNPGRTAEVTKVYVENE